MIAFLRDELGAAAVAEALVDPGSQCYAHALNLCDVFYDFERFGGRQKALQAIADLESVGVIEDANLAAQVWQGAATLKARLGRISLADCFALELTGRLAGTLVTADHHEFDAIARQGSHSIRFIR